MAEVQGLCSRLDFLAGGGEVGRLMRAHDWSASPLGPPETWPQSLRSVVGLLLSSKFPMFVAWGPDLGFLYNDPYAEILGAKHPQALGARFHDIWSEIWPDISPLIDAAMAGEATYREDLQLVMNRKGFDEQTWFTFSYSPVRNEQGQVAGMYCACTETTGKVRLERGQAFRLALEERLRSAAGPREIMDVAVETLGQHLGAARVGYSEVRLDGKTIDCGSCYADGVEPIIGTFKLADFGPDSIERQRRGETEITTDIRVDAAQVQETWAAIDTRAFVSVPLVRDGRFTASLYVNHREPHAWSADEVALIEEVAARTWDAVERARAETWVRESEARFRTLTEALPQLVWTSKPQGRWDYASPQWVAYTGQAEPDTHELGWLNAVHPDDREATMRAWGEAEARGRLDVEHRLRRHDGAYRWFQTMAAPSAGAPGGATHWIGTCTDVDEVRRARDALRESEAQFRLMADATPQIVWITDTQGRVEFFNRQWTSYTGAAFEPTSAAEVAASFVHPEDAERTMAAFEAARATESTFLVEHRIRSKAGAYRWFLVRAEPYHDPQTGELVRWFGASVDIHDRKEAEAALRESERRLRAAILASPFPTMLHAEDGEVLELSRKWTELTGYGRDEIRTHHDWGRLAYPDGTTAFDEQITEEFASEGEVAAGEWEIRAKDGTTRVWDFYNVGLGRLPDGRKLQFSAAADVTERKAAEAALRTRGEEFETLADNIPTLCWMAYADGHIYWYNRRWYEYTGASPESQLGWGWESVHDPKVLPKMAERWRRSLATGEPFEMTFPLKGADGRFRPFLTRIVPIRDEDGRITRWFGTNVDISEQVEAERLLEQRVAEALAERKLWADVFESSDALIAALAHDHRYLAVNKAYADEFERIYGVRPKAGDSLAAVLADRPEHREAALAVWDRALSGEEFSLTEEFGDPERDRPYYDLRFNTLRDRDGKTIGAFQYAVDVTERMRDHARLAAAEAARREADALYRAYFQNTAEALFVIGVQADGGFTIEELNPAHQAATGLIIDEIRGKRLEEQLPPEVAEAVAQHYRQAATTAEVQSYRESLALGGQVRHWDTVLVPVVSPEGRVTRLIGAGRDVTAQVQAEDALRQAQKMEAVGQLTGGIAHDFNNLLGAVIGGFDLIRRKPNDPERVRRIAENGLAAAERGAKLTGQLLAFSRAQQIEKKPLVVSEVVAGMRDLLARTLGPQVRLRFDLDGGRVPVLSDPVQLEMAVLNLAINARDAMPDGGELTIRTRTSRVRQDPELAPGEYVELSVTDTGTGMSPDVAARAFDPFFTTKGVGKGTGLGLSQVYGIARQAGGAARIESRPGAGTTINLFLPRTNEELSAPLDEAAPEEVVSTAAATILVIDDDEDLRRMLVDSLDALGYRVVEAPDGRAGLAALEEHAPDLVLVDFAMPGMNGAEVAEAVRVSRPELPIVFASGYADTAAIERAAGPSAAMLRKPFRVDELQAVLAEALIGRS